MHGGEDAGGHDSTSGGRPRAREIARRAMLAGRHLGLGRLRHAASRPECAREEFTAPIALPPTRRA
jgi:hypothetical protein